MKTSGFTLAEVLITLGIIGIVAAMTIPSLINNSQEAQYKSAYKKAYSVANQALKKAEADNNLVEYYDSNDSAYAIWDALKSNFKVVKYCNNANNDQCWNMNGEQVESGLPEKGTEGFVDASGMSWVMRCPRVSASTCGNILYVDTNGWSAPNKFGKDRWGLGYKVNDSKIPIEIIPYYMKDYTDSVHINLCPTGPCYYFSWLYK